jgi:hypothetical protein
MINNASQMGGTFPPPPPTEPLEPLRPPPQVRPPPPREPPPPRPTPTQPYKASERSSKPASSKSGRSRDIESGKAPLLSSSTGGQGGAPPSEEKLSTPAERKAERLCSYILISIALQVLCAILTVLIVLWITIQALRSVALLGISQEPPGLTYANEFFESSPPASPPQFLFGRL